MNVSDPSVPHRRSLGYALLCATTVLVAAGLVVYSQTRAFAWDEGFHVLTAQLIARGKRPYIDFAFPQTILNAYWNAFLLKYIADSWRSIHAGAALFTGLAVFLTADYVFIRFPIPRWRVAAAFAAGLTVAFMGPVVQFGTEGQAYGIALMLAVAGFRFAVASAGQKGWLTAGLAGLCSCGAAASTLLSAPVAPVIALWLLIYNRAGSRLLKLAAFVVGGIIAFLPILNLYRQGPRQTVFNVLDFHMKYRQVKWVGAIPHDILVYLSWTTSAQTVLLGLLAIAGILYVRKSDWNRALRSELWLCAWLILAIGVHISNAHPTFQRYYLFATPFASILAAAGLYFVSTRLYAPDRPWVPASLLIVLLSFCLADIIYDDKDSFSWAEFEKLANKANQVTPPNGLIASDEHLYFLAKRIPPSGFELEDSHKLELPPDKEALFHIFSQKEYDARAKAGVYDTILVCDDDDRIKDLGLTTLYSQKFDVEDCSLFWGKQKTAKK